MSSKEVLVFGVTGNVGGAAARELLRRGWQVRGVTRSPQSERAQAAAALGLELVPGDMDDPASLAAAFAGIDRVFSVQNWMTTGVEGEIRQGKAVAAAAHAAGVKHVVYGSAGTGDADTGIPHFDNKLVVEAYMRELGLPFTVVRPTPFMELMTQKDFFPPLSTWGTMPRVIGWDTPVPWVSVEDIGITIANIFENPEKWIGREVNNLAGDVQSLQSCRAIIREVTGKSPFGVPFPALLFRKMVGDEMVEMWRWFVTWVDKNGLDELNATVEHSREVHPEIRSVESWLRAAH